MMHRLQGSNFLATIGVDKGVEHLEWLCIAISENNMVIHKE